MPQNTVTRINQFEWDWANIEVDFLGEPIVGITKIEYDYAQDMKPNYGAGTQLISYSYGRVTYNASMELYLTTFNKLIDLAPNGDPCQIPPFIMTIKYGTNNQSTPGSGETFTDILTDVQIMKYNRSLSEGEMGVKITIPLMISNIICRV